MVLSIKRQCYLCKFYGTVYDGWCCRAVDEQGKVDYRKVSRRSNAWCLDYEPNSRKLFEMHNFHVVGKYFTERYGKNVVLSAIKEGNFKYCDTENATDFKIEITSSKLRHDFKGEFSLAGSNGLPTFREIADKIRELEV